MLITTGGGAGGHGSTNPVQSQISFTISMGGGVWPGATFPMSCRGRKWLRALDCGFPLERKRNSLEATEEQLIHDSSRVKESALGALSVLCPQQDRRPRHRARRQDMSSNFWVLLGWRAGLERTHQPRKATCSGLRMSMSNRRAGGSPSSRPRPSARQPGWRPQTSHTLELRDPSFCLPPSLACQRFVTGLLCASVSMFVRLTELM